MIDFFINHTASTTRVIVQDGALQTVGAILAQPPATGRVCIVTDARVGELYAPRVEASLAAAGLTADRFTFQQGEASKSLTVLSQLYDALAAQRLGRDGLILALGGGVVSDLAGFAAATWLRGVRFAIIATTVESAVDACLGGKTAVNIPAGKNLVGAFHQPTLVLVDPACLATLDPRDTVAGLAESIKHALLFDADFLAWHEANAGRILQLDPPLLADLIARNLRCKGRVVEHDPHESRTDGPRRIFLNFGHTIGHAIERCCGYSLRHGECVGLGMLAAARLGRELGVTPEPLVTRLEDLLAAFELPTRLEEPMPPEQIMACVRVDKKAAAGRVQFVLLEDVGQPVIRADVPEEAVGRAYATLI